MADYDKIYKKNFTSAEMIADLLLFVHEDWVQELDKTTLEKVGGEYVSDDLRHRESDVVWRLRWGKDRWLYVYVLLEFQSTVDPFMALRLMVSAWSRTGVRRTSSGCGRRWASCCCRRTRRWPSCAGRS